MRIDTINGVVLDDIITWRWESADDTMSLTVFDPADGTTTPCELERDLGQQWGITFDDVLFDGIRTCRNACVFCFMSMLPPKMRDTLYLRDDDYRLSFLQGNFVTLTNVEDADLARIIEYDLEPMNVSIHAVTPEARRALMGKNAARGMEVLERLCDAGIEIHGQVVVCPGLNDGDELRRTLDWVEAHPNVTSLACVPLGYTKDSPRFTHSFSDEPVEAKAVIDLIRPYQERSRKATGSTRFQLSDEFYLDAHVEVPAAELYDGYPQFYDGIGMLRSYIDDTESVSRSDVALIHEVDERLSTSDTKVILVTGEAAEGVAKGLSKALFARTDASVAAIHNDYFGGNVNVAGLIVGRDLLAQLPRDLTGALVIIPTIMLNADGYTLDDVRRVDIEHEIAERGGDCLFCDSTPFPLVRSLAKHLGLR
jgi:putative radical SAM enzyme (TIGR03279 family)